MNQLENAARQALDALIYHQEQTRPIAQTAEAIDAMTTALALLDAPLQVMAIDWEYETPFPIIEMDAIYAEYAKSFGKPAPDAEMARIVEKTQVMLFRWWAWHRQTIRDALVAAQENVALLDAVPAAEVKELHIVATGECTKMAFLLDKTLPGGTLLFSAPQPIIPRVMMPDWNCCGQGCDVCQPTVAPLAQPTISPEVIEAASIEAAAKWIDARREAYDDEHGVTDPETGTREYPGDGNEYVFELHEIAEGIRALVGNASQPAIAPEPQETVKRSA